MDLAKLPPESLKLEITETALVSQLDLAISVLGRLRSHGVSIAIDDFGTGYSSLTYLRQLPVDTIKIDRSFVTKIHRKPEQISILKTICGLAKLLALNTVAEGVETESERAALEKLGVDYGQGWLFGKPAPIDLKPNHNRAIGPTERTSGDQR